MSGFSLSGAVPPIRAVLWDMDGLLADTEPLWTVAEVKVCEAVGGTFTPELKARMVGQRLDTATALLLEDLEGQGCTSSVDSLSQGLLDTMVELFSGELHFMPGALALMSIFKAEGIPQALVSSSYRVLVDAVCALLPDGSFDFVLGGDEVVHAKPAPEPYVTAAARLEIPPAQCLVLEDSASGMESAHAAGCQAIMIPSVHGVRTEPEWTLLASLTQISL